MIIVLLGESGSGKSTLRNYLTQKYDYGKIVTYTTREPRLGERDGEDYNFISKDDFKEKIANGFFAETAIYNGWHYGSAKEDYDGDKVVILTPSGMREVKKILTNVDIVTFYIKAPRRERLVKILQRGDDIEEAYRRNLSDVGQFAGVENEVSFTLNNPFYSKSAETLCDEVFLKANCLFAKQAEPEESEVWARLRTKEMIDD